MEKTMMGEWQIIETAPKDGTGIILWGPEWSTPDMGYWDVSGGYGWYSSMFGFPGIEELEPTHWMPIPEPPK